MATTAGLPPLPPPTGQELLERVAVRRLQHSFSQIHQHKSNASQPASNKAAAGAAGDWPSSPQRQKTIQLTRFYDKLSKQYKNSLDEFHTSTHAQDEHARLQVVISHARNSQHGGIPTRSSKPTSTNTLAAQRKHAQFHVAWQGRDFDKSFALMADLAVEGKILNAKKDQMRPAKRWSKTATAGTIRRKLLLTKGAQVMAGQGKVRTFNGFGWTTSRSLLLPVGASPSDAISTASPLSRL